MNHLLFVYNAKSDIINSTFDFAHKIISPKTYGCNLCKLTHGNFGEKKSWKEFKEQNKNKLEFYHKDEFEDMVAVAAFENGRYFALLHFVSYFFKFGHHFTCTECWQLTTFGS